ncbi:L-lysine 6-transaminase [Acetomicrobium sp.]|uniref:L-lysine 6-transaminase n=1 Tax=Acetomicrobium sp. TaxID=1872099 RepID=UPI0028720D6A|nr:L-lysine 6-transaminase [Acetomicrobium sp.]MDR9770396.1 L-lysine 6-transaminase [Acetomicrobium sp.]
MVNVRWAVTPEEVFPVLERWILRDGFNIVIDMEKSEGSWIVDARTGEKWLDFYTFFASAPFGMNHPKLANDEFKEKIFRAAINKVANSDIYTVEMAEFVKTFSEVAVPSGFNHLFFIDYGTLAIENALKVAMDWKVRKLLAQGKITKGVAIDGKKGTKVIHFRDSFHGRSGYTLTLTNTADPNKHQYFAKYDWPRVLNPKIIWPLEQHIEAVKWEEEVSESQILKLLWDDPDDYCAIIIETIQGEGGDNHFRTEFFKKLRKICDEYDLMLILDEVQCGMGITGKMWAFQHHDFMPDIVAFGKKSQVCGIMVGPKVDEVPENCFTVSSRINSTWGGNICDMVRSTRYLEIYRDDNILDYVANIAGPQLFNGLQALGAEFPKLVTNVRGKGLMCAFDLPCPDLRNEFLKKMRERHVLLLACGTRSVRFRPALDIAPEEIDRGLSLAKEALAELSKEA